LEAGEALALAYATWPGGVRPKAHLSSPRTELVAGKRGPRLPRADQHADVVTPWDAADVLRLAPGPLDVMLEAKAKDLALLWLRRQLAQREPQLAALEETRQMFDNNESAGTTVPYTHRKEPPVGAVSKYATVNAPVERVYSYWRDFTHFPQFLPHVKEVTPISGDDTRTHWKVEGPLGVDAEWDARIVEDVPNEKIAWASDEGSRVMNSGVVRFESQNGHTNIEVAFEYDPPAGKAGEIAAKLFEDPEQQVEDALERFNQIVQSWS
jgi:uncharacterized protein YndB with AHSA1/START domain